jgi:hypothetical protein
MAKQRTYARISDLIREWTEALEQHGDLQVVIDYDQQYFWSPTPDQFQLDQAEGETEPVLYRVQ